MMRWGKIIPAFLEFTPIYCQIGACLNLRPLVPLFSNLDDAEVLIPDHFLVQRSTNTLPEADCTQRDFYERSGGYGLRNICITGRLNTGQGKGNIQEKIAKSTYWRYSFWRRWHISRSYSSVSWIFEETVEIPNDHEAGFSKATFTKQKGFAQPVE